MANRHYNKQTTQPVEASKHSEIGGIGSPGGTPGTQRGINEQGRKGWDLTPTDDPMPSVPQGKPYSTGERSALKTPVEPCKCPAGGTNHQPQGRKGWKLGEE